MYFNCYFGQMFVSDVSDFWFVGKVEPYFLSAGEVVYYYKTTMSGFQWSPEMLAKALFGGAKTKNRA